MAEENSLTYEQLDSKLLQAQYSRDISLSSNRPSVNLSTGLGAYWSSYEDSNGDRQGAQLGVNDLSLSTYYSLYNWGAKQASTRATKRYYERFLIDYRQNMAVIARDLRIRFLQLILDKFSLKTLELEVSINQANIDQDNMRHEQGRLSAENFERSMNSRKSRLLDLENLKRGVERSIEDFNFNLGIENGLTVQDIPTSIPQIGNLNDELMSLAHQTESRKYSDIPNIQKTQIDLDNAEDDIISARSRTKPSVGLSGRVSLDIEPTSGNQRVISFSTGLGISWNIYSGGANTKRILNELNDRTLKLSEFRQQLEKTKIDLDRALEDMVLKYNKLEIAESEYQLALQSYEKSKEEYDRGRVSELQFLNIELGRLYQERSIYNARKDYIISICDFLNMLGKDPVLDILQLPEEKDLSYIIEQY